VLDGRCKRNENVLTIEAGVKREEVRRLYVCVGVFECSYGSFMRKGRISDKNNRKTEDAEVPSKDEPTPPADGSCNKPTENQERQERMAPLLTRQAPYMSGGREYSWQRRSMEVAAEKQTAKHSGTKNRRRSIW
jgi:hypothetical protein